MNLQLFVEQVRHATEGPVMRYVLVDHASAQVAAVAYHAGEQLCLNTAREFINDALQRLGARIGGKP